MAYAGKGTFGSNAVQLTTANGGKQRTKVWTFLPDRPYQLVYCEDCFGNVIEGVSHSYAEVFSSMPGWHGARNAA